MPLTESERLRYERQLMLPDIGEAEQVRLKQMRLLIVGAGGIGSPLILYLAAAGIGALRIVDSDVVALSNLQRQILYRTVDVGRFKAELAAQRASELNPYCRTEAVIKRFGKQNAMDLAVDCDMIIDATDNLATRYLLDATARACKLPYLYGAIQGYTFQSALFTYRNDGPGYSDLFPEYNEGGDEAPVAVFAPAVGVLGSLMAAQALKALLRVGESLDGKLLRVDIRSLTAELFSFL